jgi:hypothetical protein
MPDWSILNNALQSNPGEHFRQGMARGLMGGAMQGNGASLNALMGVDPGAAAAMQDRQSQMEARSEQTRTRELANRRNDIIMGASFLEGIDQLPPEQRPAFYMSAIQRAQAAGVNIEGAPPQYDEAYVGGVRQTAQALVRSQQRPQQPQQGPTIQREVEYYRSIGRNDLAEMRLENHAEGAPVLFDVTGDGYPDLVPRSQVRGAAQRPAPQPLPPNATAESLRSEAADAIRAGADPSAVAAELGRDLQQLQQGGASPSNGSQTFPAPDEWQPNGVW